MPDRESIEKLLVTIRAEREDAEALACQARDRLVRLASGMVPLAGLDVKDLRAAADTMADETARFQALRRCTRDLRGLLT